MTRKLRVTQPSRKFLPGQKNMHEEHDKVKTARMCNANALTTAVLVSRWLSHDMKVCFSHLFVVFAFQNSSKGGAVFVRAVSPAVPDDRLAIERVGRVAAVSSRLKN